MGLDPRSQFILDGMNNGRVQAIFGKIFLDLGKALGERAMGLKLFGKAWIG
jgi:hypothetical protein